MDRQERMEIERENKKEVDFKNHQPHFMVEDDVMIKHIKTKRVPIIIRFKRKDGSIVEIKAEKIVEDEDD